MRLDILDKRISIGAHTIEIIIERRITQQTAYATIIAHQSDRQCL